MSKHCFAESLHVPAWVHLGGAVAIQATLTNIKLKQDNHGHYIIGALFLGVVCVSRGWIQITALHNRTRVKLSVCDWSNSSVDF